MQILSNSLEEWMISQNDSGRETELDAKSRQCQWRQNQDKIRDQDK